MKSNQVVVIAVLGEVEVSFIERQRLDQVD